MHPVPDLAVLIQSVEDARVTPGAPGRVARAASLARELDRFGDALVTHFIADARQSGLS